MSLVGNEGLSAADIAAVTEHERQMISNAINQIQSNN